MAYSMHAINRTSECDIGKFIHDARTDNLRQKTYPDDRKTGPPPVFSLDFLSRNPHSELVEFAGGSAEGSNDF